MTEVIIRALRRTLIGALILGVFVVVGLQASTAHAAPGINQQLNFQGRLLTASGATVADGYYNMQFKIYQDGAGTVAGNPSGTLKWTESWLNTGGNGVQVKNGYMSVQLGSITSLSAVDWNQDTLWLSINVGNTNVSCSPFTSCAGDGEMLPMKRLASTPYAFNAGQLGGLTSAQFLQLAQGVQTEAGTNSTSIAINKTGTGGNFLKLQASTVDVFTIANTGDVTFGSNIDHAIAVATAPATTAGKNLTISAGTAGTGGSALTGGTLVLQGGTGGGTAGNGGNVTLDAGAAASGGVGGTINIGTTNASAVNIGQSTTLAAGKSLTITGSGTRPSSPTEGMVYYDTTTKQLLTYSNGKWQSDRSDATKIVAASNASQALKDSADYVATGTSDQTIINTALTAAAGGRVYLTEGLFTTDDAISIPNDTTLAGAGRGSLIKFANINGQTKNMITNTDTTATSKGVTVRDLQLDGNWTGVNTTGTIHGIYMNSLGGGSGSTARQGPTILNTWVVNFLSYGIYLNSSPNGIVSGNNIQAGGGNGIYLSASNRMTVTGNTSQGNTGSGIVIAGESTATITGNVFAVNGTAGIYLNGGSNNNTISGNTLYNNGGGTANNSIYFPGSANADFNTITSNSINDTSGTTTNYAINITDNTSDKNYLSGNVFTSTAGTSTINDAGTGTVYASQPRAESGAQLTNRTANDAQAFTVQNATGSNIFAVDTTSSQVVLGNSTTAGKLNISDGSSNTGTIVIGPLAGNYTYTIPTTTADDTFCLVTLNNCAANSALFIQNQNAAVQTSSNFWISGTARADTSLLTPTIDTATGVALNIGTASATSVNIGKSTTVTTINGKLGITLDTTTGTTITCRNTSGYLSVCDSSVLTPTGANFIQNGTSVQTSANFWIDGFGKIAGGVQTGSVDTIGAAGSLNIGTSNAGSLTIGKTGVTTTIQGNIGVTLNATTGTTQVCRNGTGLLSSCDATYLAPTATNFIQNQATTPGTAQTANFNITGTGIAATLQAANVVGTTFDTATGVALNIGASGTPTTTAINLNQDATLAAGKSLTLVGGNTASRPGSPTEGMLYYDTTTKQLLVYANGKWQADRSTSTKIVAASNSSQAAKDSADYVATGSGDQAQINSALTAAAGGKVYLMDGTYTINASISIPNNTMLAGAGRGTLITIVNSFNTSINAITNTTGGGSGTGVAIQDLRLDGNRANQTSGTMRAIYFNGVGSGTGGSVIEGGEISNVWMREWRNEVIAFNASSHNTVTGSVIDGSDTNAISLTASSANNTITGNNVENANNGIYVSSSSNNTITGNTVQGNSTGIYLTSSSSNAISGNNASGNGSYAIYLLSSSNNTISGNTAVSGGYRGIVLVTSSNNAITGNTVASNNSFGMFLDGSSANTITSNNVQANANSGLYVYNSSNSNNISTNKFTDNGGTTDNEALTFDASDSNSVTNNTITDSSATTTNYAINLMNSTSDTNYISGNTLGSGSIHDLGTGTSFGGQLNSSGNYVIQPASGTISLMKDTAVTGTLSASTAVLSPNIDRASAGTLTIGTNATNTTALTIGSGSVTTTIQGNTGVTLNATTGTTMVCRNASGVLATCDAGYLAPTATNFIQNQATTPGSAQTANFNISGTGIATTFQAATSVLTPLLDAATASTVLSIGTTNASAINLNQSAVLAAGKSLTLTGGNTASRPGSPTDGMMYYDSTTKQLLVYNSGTAKWQADRSTATKIVAASNASQAAKDGADYIATGTSDQTIINTALTAAAGGQVYLTEGTFTTDDVISIPNDTTLSGAGRGSLIKFANINGQTKNMITNTDTTATSKGVTVRDLQLDGNWTGVNTTGTIHGIAFSSLGGGSGSTARQGPTVLNTWVVNFLTYGIYLNSSPNGIVSGNNVQAGGGNGIYLSSSNRVNVTSNISQGNNGSGIVVSGGVADTINSNTFATNGTAGVYVNGSSNNNTISGNNLYNNGGGTTNNAIYFPGSANGDFNTITSNTINDTSGTTNNYAINFVDNTSNSNYLADNVFTSTAGTSTINDPAGTNTVYANQSRAEGGGQITNRTVNDTQAFAIQKADGTNILAVDTTNNKVLVAGTLDTTTATQLNIGTVTANAISIGSGAITTTIQGNTGVTLNATTGTTMVCRNASGVLATCDAGYLAPNSTSFILNGSTQQASSNFNISGTGTATTFQAATSVLAPLLDAATASTVLNVGTTNASAINLNQNAVLAAGKSLTMTGGNTASRPAAPTDGMMYYDTSTDQLLVYNTTLTKWVADKSPAILVAASNSSAGDKAAADYIATGTNDQTQINAALTSADPAGTGRKTGKVVLFAGTYTIGATISVPNNTTLAGSGAGTVITIPNSVNASFTAVTNTTTGGNGTGVVIQDLKLDGNKAGQSVGSYGMFGITFNGMGSSTLQGGKILNVWVNNWYGNGAFLWTYSGIYISTGQHNTISNAMVQGNSTNGIAITGTYNTVTGSDFAGNNYGIHLNANNNTITGNSSSGNTAIGIYLEGANQNTISGNVATGNTNQNIYLFTSSSNTVSGNQALGSGASDGIGLASTSTYNIISSNIIQANSSGGVSIASTSTNNTITGNKIHNNGGNSNKGIYFSNSNSNVITNNTISDLTTPTSNNPINIDSSSANTYLSNNYFSSTAANGTIADASTTTVYVNQPKAEGGGQQTNRTLNDTAAFTFQKADGTNVLAVDTTNSKVLIAGTLDTTTATQLNIGTVTANAISIGSGAITTTIAGNTGVTLNGTTGTTMVCRNASGLLSSCDATYLTPTASNFIQNQNAAAQTTANFWISGSGQAASLTAGTVTASTNLVTPSIDTASAVALTLGGVTASSVDIGKSAGTVNLKANSTLVGTSGSTITIQGAAQSTSNTAGNQFTLKGSTGNGSGAGGQLTVQGGDGGATSGANGGNLLLSGGAGTGTGVAGLVVFTTPTFSTVTNDANCFTGGATVAASCTIAAASVNGSSAILVGFNVDGQTATLPSPTITTAGRVIYVTASSATNDFTLSVNGGGQGNLISMRKNTTATMIWNGSAWTAAGASSSTTLQASYDNTLQSAGGAELVVSKTTATNGLTIRDSTTNSVNGALLTVQSSSAANLFSVNSNVTEYATDAGAEVYGASTTTFPANTWATLASPVSTVSRYITAGDNIATGQGSVSVVTPATINAGVMNRLSSSLTANQTYNVSFSARLAAGSSAFTDMTVYYSINGSAQSVVCATGQTAKTSIWTKINCTFQAPASGITSTNSILIQQATGVARTLYVDNLSVTIAANFNYATDAGVDNAGSFATNWSVAGTSTVTQNLADGFDASSSAQITTSTANSGVRNLLSINPLLSTLYRVSVYTKLNSGAALTDFKVRYTPNAGTNFIDCVDYNTQVVGAGWAQINCYIKTDATALTTPYVYFLQTTASGSRVFSVDTFSMTLASNSTPNVQIGSGSNGGPTTLFTVDKGASAPIAANNDALLGSMYYDTTLGKLQCYEADGWGACGSSPDNIITISPEYTNAVMHGTGIGTMTSDFCSSALNINDGTSSQPTICGAGETYNFYKWTSPQATSQAYSIYVTYQLPTTFKTFASGQTSVQARVDSTTNASVQLQIYKNHSGLTTCGSNVTLTTSANTWQSPVASGTADPSTCGFVGGDSIVFKITLSSKSNANAYIGNLNFTFSNK